jgi:uncharacterized RDD family membrane protein YckC
MLEDLGRRIGRATQRVDEVAERIARRILFRRPRALPTERAGAATRGLALGLDALIVNLVFSGLAALAGLIASAIWGPGDGLPPVVIALGSFAWAGLAALYAVGFWSLAGQTPGMRFFGIRLAVEGEGLPLGSSLRRLAGSVLAVIPFGLGFLGILTDERRRGWQDRLGRADVLYERRDAERAPWSTLEPEPVTHGSLSEVSSSAV